MTSHSEEFQAPKDGQTYYQEIVDRCTSLINYGLWGDLHLSHLRTWLSNFTTYQEKYFAACVLDSLIYRSKEQTIALMKHLFQRILPDLSRLHATPIGPLNDCLQNLQRLQDPRIRLITAVKSDDPPTKSAHIIARYMRQHLGIRESWIIKPWEIRNCTESGIRIFIFIDDFLGTGDQFEILLRKESLQNNFLGSTYAVYAPLAAHERGIRHLRATFPELHVTSVEVLDDTYGLFHPQSPYFHDGTNTTESAKSFYYNLLRTKGIDITGPGRRGYGHLELTYAFEHATPDNSIPILWWPSSTAWRPLFPR